MNKTKLDLQPNIPSTFTLLQQKPATGSNGFGNWYLYNVNVDGHEHSFFANEEVYKQIQDKQINKGDTITVTKIVSKNGKDKSTRFVVEKEASLNNESSKEKAVNGNGHLDYYDIMHDCLTKSLQLQKDIGSVIDVNRIAITLFITETKQRNGAGYSY